MAESHLTDAEHAAAEFHAVLRTMITPETQPEVYPSVLAAATQRVLGAEGAGLSIVDVRHRVPIGASTTHAVCAERLQFTVGAGPCLEAIDGGRPVRVDAGQMQQEWPTFYDELEQQTPYRSIVAVPFDLGHEIWGALDLYFHSSHMPDYGAVTATRAVTREIAGLLTIADSADSAGSRWQSADLPDWAYGRNSRARLRTWIAVGMVVAALALDVDDALARLRAFAYSHDSTLDEISGDLIDGVRSPQDLERD